ncbi:hypothetical protein SAMN02745216_01685 [Desulfatibacillum alkenivorans DSM 16219]|uniref:Gluconate 2-dehydrogenase subunit 3 n=1 Tax=Desulfatibacillum alkenivorans DSM 16219 TaxID=1121393 RepID=A0A1M6JBJ2_9BACT|nr:hypothetical protein [Desulfatibacillum alkenivorans]SHJ44033.1 hypothetical protein SAMN02745216_01685 [Desulfatibacillum alkenivorans DSM 16219]
MNRLFKIWRKKTALAMAAAMVMGCLWAPPARSGEMAVDLSALIYETQKASRAMEDVLLAWWVPQELWLMFLSQSQSVSEEEKQKYLGIMDPYMVFLVVDGTIGEDGRPRFQAREDVLNSLVLEDAAGNKYKTLREMEISQEAKDFLSRVFPSFARSLGPLGNNLYYAVFTSKNSKGDPIANVFTEGTFVLHMAKRSFRWRTPLGALVPPKHCPITGEELNGGWKYNPWNGAKLE